MEIFVAVEVFLEEYGTVAFPEKAADIAFGFRGQAAGGPDKGAALQSLNEHIHARRAAVDTDGFHEAEHRAVVGELEKPAPRVAEKILDAILPGYFPRTCDGLRHGHVAGLAQACEQIQMHDFGLLMGEGDGGRSKWNDRRPKQLL